MIIKLSEANLTPAATILQLKGIFAERTGFPINSLQCQFNYTILQDHNTFSNYGIGTNTGFVIVSLAELIAPATAG